MTTLIRSLVRRARLPKHLRPIAAGVDDILEAYGTRLEDGQQLNPADAFFAFRLMLGRHPDHVAELPAIVGSTQTYREFSDKLHEAPELPPRFPPNLELMAEVKEGFRFWFNTSDREMGVRMSQGRYEPELVALLEGLLRPGMTCVDVGAQTGFYTCLMASRVGTKGKVFAFEPRPTSFRLLSKNVEENELQNRCSLHPVAASERAARLEATEVAKMYVVGQVHGGSSVTIEALPIDDIIDERVDLVKIDIEGHEPAALAGMRRSLERYRPTILSEINAYWLQTCSGWDAERYITFLNSMGYDVFDVRDGKPLIAGAVRLGILDTIDIVARHRDAPGA